MAKKRVNTLSMLKIEDGNNVESLLQSSPQVIEEMAKENKEDFISKNDKPIESNKQTENSQGETDINEEKEGTKKRRTTVKDFLERPNNFVKEKTENLSVNVSQRNLLKLLATLEGSQVNILVYNILDDFLEKYDIKELANMIERTKKKLAK